MAPAGIRRASALLLVVLLTPACDSGAGRKPWPIPGASTVPSYPRPPELEGDAEEPLRVGLTNFGLVFVREPSRAKIERWIDYVGWLVPVPQTTVTVGYPKHTFVVSDAACGNGRLDIDGVRWEGGAFALSPDGSVEAVTALDALGALAASDDPEPSGN